MEYKKRVLVQTGEQLEAVFAEPSVTSVYLDSAFFLPESWKGIRERALSCGKKLGLKFPQVFRAKAEMWFQKALPVMEAAAFDLYLAQNLEEICALGETELLKNAELVIDHTVYVFNSAAEEELKALVSAALRVPEADYTETFSLELTVREMAGLKGKGGRKELVVYGRAPLMASAQCVHRTARSCDHREETLFLKDRTGALFPVKNSCTFCLGTIYNSVPTVFYDRTEEIGALPPDFLRWEFTVETAQEVRDALSCRRPEAFTRGHMKKGVE